MAMIVFLLALMIWPVCNGEAERNAKSWLDHVRLGIPWRASETTEITVGQFDCLAVPAIYFHDPENIDAWVHQYQELRKFIHKIHPGAEILITNKGEPPDEVGWEQLPFLWNGFTVWIKRHSIYDNIHDYYERLDTSA